MSLLSKTQSLCGILFFVFLYCSGAWIVKDGTYIIRELGKMEAPASLQEVRDTCAELQNLLELNLPGKQAAWSAHAFFENALGKRETNNFSVLRGENGRLFWGSLFPIYLQHAKDLAEDFVEFARAAQAGGAKVLYVNAPDSILKGEKEQLAGNLPFKDYNTSSDVFLQILREKDVPFIDARYFFLSEGFPSKEISPPSSSQLSGRAAFALFTYMLDGLEAKCDARLDPDQFFRNISNYKFTFYPYFFIGSLGKATGPAFSGIDDFTSVEPYFATNFSVESVDMFGRLSKAEGDAAAVLLHKDALAYDSNLYTLYPSSYYRHANSAWTVIRNLQQANGPKVLYIHDFYTAQIPSHLAPLCGELHTLAYQEAFKPNALQYIANNKFDYIVASFYPGNLTSPDSQMLLLGEQERKRDIKKKQREEQLARQQEQE